MERKKDYEPLENTFVDQKTQERHSLPNSEEPSEESQTLAYRNIDDDWNLGSQRTCSISQSQEDSTCESCQ